MKIKLPNLTGDIEFFDRISLVERLTFTKHISLMLKSGITLSESIQILEKQTTHEAFKRILRKINKELANGQKFYTTLEKFPHIFDLFYTNMVRIGEESGKLEENLDYLAIHLQKQHEFENKITGALLYPLIVLGVAFATWIGLSLFVLPKLVDLFNSLDVELPLSTRILLFAATIMRDYGFLIVGGLVVAIIVFRSLVGTILKPWWHRFILSLPIFGSFLQSIELATLFRNLGIMLSSGMPIELALTAQRHSTNNVVYQNYLKDLEEGVSRGQSLEKILDSWQMKFFPLVATRMIGVGEKTGKLDETFSYLGDFFEDEVDNVSKNLTTILEPIMLIIVGLVVGFIAISIIGPIYQFTGSIKR